MSTLLTEENCYKLGITGQQILNLKEFGMINKPLKDVNEAFKNILDEEVSMLKYLLAIITEALSEKNTIYLNGLNRVQRIDQYDCAYSFKYNRYNILRSVTRMTWDDTKDEILLIQTTHNYKPLMIGCVLKDGVYFNQDGSKAGKQLLARYKSLPDIGQLEYGDMKSLMDMPITSMLLSSIGMYGYLIDLLDNHNLLGMSIKNIKVQEKDRGVEVSWILTKVLHALVYNISYIEVDGYMNDIDNLIVKRESILTRCFISKKDDIRLVSQDTLTPLIINTLDKETGSTIRQFQCIPDCKFDVNVGYKQIANELTPIGGSHAKAK